MTQSRLWRVGALAVAIALLAAAPSSAQTTGRIEGRVLDSSGAVLPGVLMSASSNALQGIRTTNTDTDGRFRFLALPPGMYNVKGELAGFKTVEMPDVRVSLDSTVTLEMSLSPATVTETVTVTGTAPVIDVTSTTTGAKFDTQLIESLPVARNFQGLAFNAPGVVSGGLGSNPSIGGASAAENRYVVDGLDTTDPAFGTIGTSLPFEFIQEVEVKTGGYQAEYGGALGGILNVLTKSGSNQLKGDVFGYYTSDALQAEEPDTETFGRNLGHTKYDFGADVGGKLIQDQLWFFAAVNPTFSDEDYTNRQELAFTTERRTMLYSAKLNWRASPNHQIVASIFGDPQKHDNVAFTRNSAGLMLQNDKFGATNMNLTYNGILGSGLFLELSAGRSDQNDESFPINDQPRYESGETGRRFAIAQNCGDPTQILGGSRPNFNPGCLGGGFVQETGDRARNELRGALSWFTSTGSVSHQFKVGAHLRRVKYHDWAHYPAPRPGVFRDSTGKVVDAEGLVGQYWRLRGTALILQEYDQNSKGQTDEMSVFIQDQLKFGERVTVNLGLRFDASESTGERSAEFPDRKLEFGLGDMIAPRIGIVIDVTGDGKSKLYGHYGRFFESIPLDINARSFGNEQFNLYYFRYPAGGVLPTYENPGTHFYTYSFGTGVGVQEGLEAQYSQEWVGGFEYQVARNLSVGIKGVFRNLGQVIEDISVDGGHTYFIANLGQPTTYANNPVHPEEVLDPPVTFPKAEREYKALELSINKAFSDSWQLAGSYVYSKNEGNYGGLFRQDNGQLDPNITSLFDLPELLRGAFGLLPNDRPHQFKLYGSYQWPFKLVTGFYSQFLSGTPISKLGAHPLYGRRERFIIPRGSFGRTPDIWNIDLHLEYPIKLGRADLRLIGDLFNVTNRLQPSTVDQEWTFRAATATTDPNECGGQDPGCADANTAFGSATAYQPPRSVRFGVKVSW